MPRLEEVREKKVGRDSTTYTCIDHVLVCVSRMSLCFGNLMDLPQASCTSPPNNINTHHKQYPSTE
jgi:hypothetical protein